MGEERLRALMLGPPGSGKGTQGERLAVRHGVPHLSSGELLRVHVRDGTVLGRAAVETMRRGDLVADGVVTDIIREEVLAPNAVGGFVLDGFPRTVPQAEEAYDLARRHGITFHAVILLEIPPEQLIDRLTRRGQLTQRADDTSVTIRHRIEVYLDHTSPLIDYYEGRNILVRVDATGSIDEVTARSRPNSTASSHHERHRNAGRRRKASRGRGAGKKKRRRYVSADSDGGAAPHLGVVLGHGGRRFAPQSRGCESPLAGSARRDWIRQRGPTAPPAGSSRPTGSDRRSTPRRHRHRGTLTTRPRTARIRPLPARIPSCAIPSMSDSTRPATSAVPTEPVSSTCAVEDAPD